MTATDEQRGADVDGARPGIAMTDAERFLFDTQGFVVRRGVLAADEVAAIVELCRRFVDTPPLPHQLQPMPDGSVRFLDFLDWGGPFRDLLDHPAVTGILNAVLAPGFRLDHIYGMRQQKGTGMLPFHGGATSRGSDFYLVRADGGHIYTGLTAVSWALTDAPPDGGGFLCIPGSHKASFALPGIGDAFRANRLIDLPDPDVVRRVDVRAGDVIIFTEALYHAGDAWTADEPRLALLYKYCPAPLSWGEHQPPREEVRALLTPAQERLFLPPYVYPPRGTVGI